MEIGIDSFAAATIDVNTGKYTDPEKDMHQLLDRIVYADEMGLDTFAIGEHYRKDFLDSANTIIFGRRCSQN